MFIIFIITNCVFLSLSSVYFRFSCIICPVFKISTASCKFLSLIFSETFSAFASNYLHQKICLHIFSSSRLFQNMFSSKHFLFINMLLFYIEDKNHFLKKINLKLDERPVWNSAHRNICPQAKSSQSVSAKILSPIQGNPKQEND